MKKMIEYKTEWRKISHSLGNVKSVGVWFNLGLVWYVLILLTVALIHFIFFFFGFNKLHIFLASYKFVKFEFLSAV
jgi:hypothetical protein